MLLQELTWPQVEALPKTLPVVLPIAAVEQHGAHLPLYTDSFLLGEIVRRVEVELQETTLFAPLMWLGNSEHHLDFAGTLTASPRVYLDLLRNLVNNLLTHRFQTIVLLNGHGGNSVPAQQALFELRQEHRRRSDLRLIAVTYWNAGPSPGKEIPDLEQTEMGHACEWETSMMLRLRPDLVGNYLDAVDVPQTALSPPGYQAWITKDRSQIGHIGRPRAGSATKGEQLLTLFARNVSQYLAGLAGR